MNQKSFYKAALLITLLSFAPVASFAETEVDQEVAQVEKIQAKDELWTQQLKKTYSLTDEQIKTLKDSGLSSPQMAMVAQLAKSSEKPLEEVLKMRTEQKKGWGEIAKELGISPKEIGQSVRNLKHALRDERKLARDERKEKRKEERDEKRESKKEEREERHGKSGRNK